MIIWRVTQALFEKGKKKVCFEDKGMEDKRKKCDKTQVVITILLLTAGIGLLWAARAVAGFAEWYSRAIYPVLAAVLSGIWGIFPFSMVEFLLYGGMVLLLFWLIRDFRRPLTLFKNYATTATLLLFLYAACCGVNYYRVPFSTYYMKQMEMEEMTMELDLKDMCLWLTEEVNKARIEFDQAEGNYENAQRKGVAAMKRLAEQYPSLQGYYPKPKPVAISWILSIQQCSGVYSPFTIEANYNRDMSEYNIPHTICHELSHLRGFMREDEANFIGYLACRGSEDADYRYSGYLLGWIYAGNALAKRNYDAYSRLYAMLDESIIMDLEKNSEFWNRYEGDVAEVQEKVNDAYLKANGQVQGVQSYGRVVDLMLIDFACHRKGKMVE